MAKRYKIPILHRLKTQRNIRHSNGYLEILAAAVHTISSFVRANIYWITTTLLYTIADQLNVKREYWSWIYLRNSVRMLRILKTVYAGRIYTRYMDKLHLCYIENLSNCKQMTGNLLTNWYNRFFLCCCFFLNYIFFYSSFASCHFGFFRFFLCFCWKYISVLPFFIPQFGVSLFLLTSLEYFLIQFLSLVVVVVFVFFIHFFPFVS